MTLELPLEGLKIYHDWTQAPLGALLRVSDENGGIAIGVRCQYVEGNAVTPLVFVPEPPKAALLRTNEIRTGAIDVSDQFELVVVDPVVQRLEHVHRLINGCLLSTDNGTHYTRGGMGAYTGYLRLTAGADGDAWQVSFDGITGARLAGNIGIRPKASLVRTLSSADNT